MSRWGLADCSRFGTPLGHLSRYPLISLHYLRNGIATERREASVPRHGTQGASRAALRARPTGALAQHPNVSRRSAHPSIGVSEAKMQNPGANMRRGNEMGCLTS